MEEGEKMKRERGWKGKKKKKKKRERKTNKQKKGRKEGKGKRELGRGKDFHLKLACQRGNTHYNNYRHLKQRH